VEYFLYATVLIRAVGIKQHLINRVRGFILWEVKAFVSCRLTTHTPALSAKE